MGFQVRGELAQPERAGPVAPQPERWPGVGALRQRVARLAHGTTAARVILGMAVALTVSAWWFSHRAVEESAAERFELRSQEIENAIIERMEGYETVLWSGVGLFDAVDTVDRDQFAEFVAALDLNDRWPGIQGVGWAVPLAPDEVDAHEASIRDQGFADYGVSPAGERDAYSAIVYLEPFDWRNQRAFGFDMWSNAERRAAMARARDTGQAATSSMITLVQETDQDVQRGFLTYVPVYESAEPPATLEGRREALVGWVYAPFRMNDLMAGILGSTSSQVDYRIYDGTAVDAEMLLFDSNSDRVASDDSLERQATVTIQGQPWTLVFRTGPGFSLGSDTLPTTLAIAGLLVEVLLFFVISSLGSLNRRAEAIAEVRTAELRLVNDALQQRSEELERQATQLTRSNDELRQFAHVASHDLQEPLRTMASYASLVSDTYGDDLGDEGRRWLGYIGGSAKRLSDLIREILQFSTSYTLNPDPIGVDLNQIMGAVQEDLAELFEDASAELVVEDLPTVAGDPVQLRRLLTNLVHNAATYRKPDTDLRVVVKADTAGEHPRVAVRDNGIGIDPEFQQRIFELFRRAAPRTEHAGVGMGLAICRKIVQAHDGTIGVVSSVGHGTEMWFEIPAPSDLGPGNDHAGTSSGSSGSLPSSRAGATSTPRPATAAGDDDRSTKEFA